MCQMCGKMSQKQPGKQAAFAKRHEQTLTNTEWKMHDEYLINDNTKYRCSVENDAVITFLWALPNCSLLQVWFIAKCQCYRKFKGVSLFLLIAYDSAKCSTCLTAKCFKETKALSRYFTVPLFTNIILYFEHTQQRLQGSNLVFRSR